MTGRRLPRADRDSQPFWDGCAAHEVRVQRCARCSATRFPPGEFCPSCHSSETEWITLPGTGTVQSYVVVHRAFDPAFGADVPYVVGLVKLDATRPPVVLPGNVRGIGAGDIRVGLAVIADYEDLGEGMAIAAFRPFETDGAAGGSGPAGRGDSGADRTEER
jgi:uncharacterized OB-fold protein